MGIFLFQAKSNKFSNISNFTCTRILRWWPAWHFQMKEQSLEVHLQEVEGVGRSNVSGWWVVRLMAHCLGCRRARKSRCHFHLRIVLPISTHIQSPSFCPNQSKKSRHLRFGWGGSSIRARLQLTCWHGNVFRQHPPKADFEFRVRLHIQIQR